MAAVQYDRIVGGFDIRAGLMLSCNVKFTVKFLNWVHVVV